MRATGAARLALLAALAALLGCGGGRGGAAAARTMQPNSISAAAPDDATLDRLFDIPALARRIADGGADAEPPEGAKPLLGPVEVWARGRRWRPFNASHTAAVLAELTDDEVAQLRSLCGRCLFHTLEHDMAVHGNGYEHVFVATGDIDAEWLRDSAVQLAIYLQRIPTHPIIRPIVEGAIRSQAYWVLYDPYANAFNRKWRPVSSFDGPDRARAKGGWVWEHKFELDSGAYFFNLLWNYYNTPGLYNPGQLFTDTTIHDAAVAILRTWRREQMHDAASAYRFDNELPNHGRGTPTNFTGLVWGGFRPSDDAQKYGFNVPANAFAAGALARLLKLNEATWKSEQLASLASALLSDIRGGLARHAVVRAPDGSRVYAYELNGLGDALLDFDDPNLPSLLALPLLGWEEYDPEVYAATRRRILSPSNPYYYSGEAFTGLGSPHTPLRYIWPLAHMVEALTAPAADPTTPARQAAIVRDLLRMQCENGLMHESVSVDDPSACTRPVFEWSNAMLAVLAQQLLDLDCEAAAQEEHLRAVARAEWDWSKGPQGGVSPLLQYARLPESVVPHEP